MSLAARAAMVAVLTVLGATSLWAAETIHGRWAADPAHCWGDGATPALSPLVVTSYAVRWLGDTCRVGRMYKTGETVHIQAFCWGAEGERAIPVSMQPVRGRLQVTWNRATRADLRRCP
ncbi:MAG: hypothetical protein Q8M26_16860 [Pseudolabrys sp.]|nr:hypothetical protein [Pseudolabrys sp.]